MVVSIGEDDTSPFIIETGVKNADAGARKLIRRHVMLGKNKGKTRQTRSKKPKTSTVVADLDIDDYGTSMRLRRSVVPKAPGTAGSGLSFIHFAEPIDLAMIADVIYCKILVLFFG